MLLKRLFWILSLLCLCHAQECNIVFCSVDGTIETLSAWTGQKQSSVSLPPLLQRYDTGDQSSWIVPDLDGRLYVYESEGSSLHALDLTIDSILARPVHSCLSPDACGVLTASSESSLLALDPAGRLMWETSQGETESVATGLFPLVLQRKDFWVQYVSVLDGRQAWNISLGTYEALDFDNARPNNAELLVTGSQSYRNSSPSRLPSISFSDSGRTITAMDKDLGSIVWQRSMTSVVASAFGICGGKWEKLDVVDSYNGVGEDSDDEVDERALVRRMITDSSEDWVSQALVNTKGFKSSLHAAGDRELILRPSQFATITGFQGPVIPLLEGPKDENIGDWPTLFLIYLGCPLILLLFCGRTNPMSYFSLADESQAGRVSLIRSSNLLQSTTEGANATEQLVSQWVEEENSSPSQSGVLIGAFSRYQSEFNEVERMGRGGFGSVFRCRHTVDGREYAVKKIFIDGSLSRPSFEKKLERVLREVKIIASLEHKSIVRYYSAWLETDSSDCAVEEEDSEYASNGDWSEATPSSSQHKGYSIGGWTSFSNNSVLDFGGGISRSQWSRSATKSRRPSTSTGATNKGQRPRHCLYIQMQLCSSPSGLSTLAEFINDPKLRYLPETTRADIPSALSLFVQIVEALEYIHKKGLIHRDLKPDNCFIDGQNTIKVGDFGLSKEATGEVAEMQMYNEDGQDAGINEHTSGVGTRSYASPEQIVGCDYDSSTDIYSLGIMLFELCYPMTTMMERSVCLSNIRKNVFPSDWDDRVGSSFPMLQGMITEILSSEPDKRPSANSVSKKIKAILSQYEIQSLDAHGPDVILLRIEVQTISDVLPETLKLVREASGGDDVVDIAQYGLRSSAASEAVTIIELALALTKSKLTSHQLVAALSRRTEILSVRQVSSTSRLLS